MQTKLIKKLLPNLIILFGLFFAACVSFGLYAYQNPKSQKTIVAAAQTKKTIKPTPSIQPSQIITYDSFNPTTTESTQTTLPVQTETSPAPVIATDTSTQTQQAQPTSAPNPQPDKLSVSVSINDTSNFSIAIDSGKNQCDVLSQALSEGKISSLNMQYNPAFSSNAVYQINGLGQEGQVWWTYSVNGTNPPLGCSHITVNNNDSVRWTYVGAK